MSTPPAVTTRDLYAALQSIDRGIAALNAHLGVRSTTSRAEAPAQPAASARPQPPAIAEDRDLDSQWGDEEVKVSPRDWSGPPMKGRRMSECPPDFLDMLAETFDYFARRNAENNALTTGGKPKADFDRRSASRARGWAQRLRAGWTPPQMDTETEAWIADSAAPAQPSLPAEPAWMDGGDDDIPF